LRKEVALLTSLNHPNLVRFCGVCLDPPLVVMEFYRWGFKVWKQWCMWLDASGLRMWAAALPLLNVVSGKGNSPQHTLECQCRYKLRLSDVEPPHILCHFGAGQKRKKTAASRQTLETGLSLFGFTHACLM
jgi:hypothetical protein